MSANRFTWTVLLASLALVGCGTKESRMRESLANAFKASCEARIREGVQSAADPELIAKTNWLCACMAERGSEDLSIEKITQLMKGGEAEIAAAFNQHAEVCFCEYALNSQDIRNIQGNCTISLMQML